MEDKRKYNGGRSIARSHVTLCSDTSKRRYLLLTKCANHQNLRLADEQASAAGLEVIDGRKPVLNRRVASDACRLGEILLKQLLLSVVEAPDYR